MPSAQGTPRCHLRNQRPKRTSQSAVRAPRRTGRPLPESHTRGKILISHIQPSRATQQLTEILKKEGIGPAPGRAATTWANFLRSQVDAVLACDFIDTVTLTGRRQYILAVIEHATRRVRVLGTTAHPTAQWVSQAARNLVMDLEDSAATVSFLIRDRDAKFPALFDEILQAAGIQTVLTGVRMPRMNALMERWV